MSKIKKKAAKKKVAPTQTVYNFPALTLIARPTEKYFLQSLLQEQGVFLVDPDREEYLDGQLNTDYLYLTLTPGESPKAPLGFIKPTQPVSEKEVHVDACLYFSNAPDGLFTGYDPETGLTYAVIQTWNDAEIEHWDKIATNVTAQAIIEDKGVRVPVFFITLTSKYHSNNDDGGPRQFILNGSQDVQAVSQLVLNPDQYEEE